MINWLVRHLDAIEDNIKRKKEAENYKDWQHIKEVIKDVSRIIYNGVGFIIGFIISFIALWVTGILLWCLFRG